MADGYGVCICHEASEWLSRTHQGEYLWLTRRTQAQCTSSGSNIAVVVLYSTSEMVWIWVDKHSCDAERSADSSEYDSDVGLLRNEAHSGHAASESGGI